MSVAETRFVDVELQPSDIVRLRVTLESYEGLGRCTTMPDNPGRVRITFLSDQQADILSLLESLEGEGWVTILSLPARLC